MGLALVTRIPNLAEAQIAAGALRSAGIEAQVFDVSFGGMEAPVIEGLGGYRIMAPESEVAAARDVLRLLRASPGLGEPDEYGPWSARTPRPARFQARGMRVLAALVLGIPLLLLLLRLLMR